MFSIASLKSSTHIVIVSNDAWTHTVALTCNSFVINLTNPSEFIRFIDFTRHNSYVYFAKGDRSFYFDFAVIFSWLIVTSFRAFLSATLSSSSFDDRKARLFDQRYCLRKRSKIISFFFFEKRKWYSRSGTEREPFWTSEFSANISFSLYIYEKRLLL